MIDINIRTRTDEQKTAHHRFGPSSLANFRLCPGWQRKESETVHPITEQGTKIHKKIEDRDLSGLTADEERMVEDSLAYLDKNTKEAAEIHQELELEICRRDDGSYATFGTADVVAVYPEQSRAVLIDWKTGFNAVDSVEDNIQLQAYAAGVFERFPDVERVEAHVFMSRFGYGDSHVFNRFEDLEEIKLTIELIILRAEELPELIPSPKACAYCGVKASCPALAKHALALANTQADEPLQLDEIEEVSSTELTNPETAAQALSLCELIEPWVKDVRAKAKALALEGAQIPGYEVRERRGRKTLGNANEVYDQVKDALTEDEFIEVCSVPLTSLKKALSDKAPQGSKGLAVELAVAKLEGAGLVEEGAPIHVLQKKKRAS